MYEKLKEKKVCQLTKPFNSNIKKYIISLPLIDAILFYPVLFCSVIFYLVLIVLQIKRTRMITQLCDKTKYIGWPDQFTFTYLFCYFLTEFIILFFSL
jgi:hypothetical protein